MKYDKRKLQLKILEMAKYIDEICQKNGIEYFLLYGTCLGAVRHEGFIPWDDDFDIGMTYDNYLKFIKVCEEQLDEDSYFLQTPDNEKNYYLSFSKVRDLNTTLIENYNQNIDMCRCVYIDVFPLVGYPTKKIQQKIFEISRAFNISANINVINNKFLYLIFKIIITLCGKKNIMKITKKYCTKFDIEKCDYICSVFDGDGVNRNLFKKEWFQSIKYVPFEDTKLPIPERSDLILKQGYGDYMTLPSEQERQEDKHNIVYLNLDENIYKKGVNHEEN